MGKIHQLDTQTANMIAAGEVVERPMGVIKELVENAIDAGSTSITVSVEEGGVKKITVQDNGCGMSAEDAEMAFQRHATSKINTQNDLWAIHTLGFRGEAVPSIASVSKMTMITSDGSDNTRIVVEYGEKVSAGAYPCNQGTEITVEGLFYRTPARLKHMRSASYESSLIQDVLARFAMSHPEIAFHFINDGRDSFRTSGQGSLLEVLFNVYGRAAAENAVEVEFEDFDYRVTGYLIKPSITRASRNMMHIFLNGRMVRTYRLYKAVQDGYAGFIPNGRYPMCVLQVEMDPHLLDVNVHPSKWEVRISKEIQLEVLLKEEVRKALNGGEIAPVVKSQDVRVDYYEPLSFDTDELAPAKKEETAEEVPAAVRPVEEAPAKEETSFMEIEEEKKEEAPVYTAPEMDEDTRRAIALEAEEDARILRALTRSVEEEEEEYEEEVPDFPLMDVIGQYHDKYILCAMEHGIALVDQHAALRRILFEKAKKELLKEPVMMDVLVPLTVHADETTVRRAEEINEALRDLHIVYEPFGPDTLMVRSIPSWLQNVEEEEFLSDLLDAYKNDESMKTADGLREKIARMACAHAVARKQKMSQEEMKETIRQLSECDQPFTSPEGKTTFIVLDENDLAKEFR